MKSQRQEIILATHNQGKVLECIRLLEHLPVKWITLSDIGIASKIQENGNTFAENATIKAEGYCDLTGKWTLADDSGLTVEALGGRPGIHTSRYGGVETTQAEKCSALLNELRSVNWKRRRARFHCVMALALPDRDKVFTAEGICRGIIAFSRAGTGGFGYDPIFHLPEYSCTMAQLSPKKKDRVSHRGLAARGLSPTIAGLLA